MARDVVGGTVRVPGDKSVSHRALIFSALGDGASRIRHLLPSDDVRATAAALQSLGWAVPPMSAEMIVQGGGLRAPVGAAAAVLDCRNSGTTTRLLAGVAAARPGATRFEGDASLSRRPMRRVAAPLEAMGAHVAFEPGRDGLPMTVTGGALRPLAWATPVASAQLKGAVLLAGLCGGVPVEVREPAPTRDHSERMLHARGVPVAWGDGAVRLQPVASLGACDVDVPGDPSSAAFFIARALLAGEGALALPGVLDNPHRDGFLRAVRRMGARIEAQPEGGGGVALRVEAGARLRAIAVAPGDVTAMIDELPMLAVLAARAEGVTEIRGAGELRVKESDRIAAVVANLRAVGVEAEELDDGLVVSGSDAPLSGHVVTHGDHRIAMAFGVLGATPGCAITLDDAACVAVSYPGFWEDLRHVQR